ncbi:MAG: hypothetical protein IJE89_02700 [Bacilli bacterium]|nr:hypothetical protein [Bacilli bacterium]
MENQKNNKGVIALLIVIIVILSVLCVLFATGTITLKSNDVDNSGTNENINDNNQTNEENNDEEKESNWVDYLLSRHILDAKVSRIRSKDLGDTEDFSKTETITMDEVNEILSNFKNSKLTKTWSQGRGGPDKDHLTIAYENNDQKYEFEIYYGTIVVDKLDDELKNILEQNKYDEKNAEYKNMEGSFYFYSIDNYNETIFDKYFN